ncbi:hypothetical protein DIURU_000908 [Diutina rugosa]|uniref:CAF1B/HIR1 beta-propeller domain-containing protein n=1 Tax=Diutina rugosa TaxID=5481 RepID=A0A642UWF5_DIURU|nr:uncharacterized protein DIURU_000908 [Diutina rugosa]KAA8906747.1 hypothetical protein DIURU_000908 [Diutina rugosa]
MEAIAHTVFWHDEAKPVYSLAFQPQGDRLITAGGDNHVRVWQVPVTKDPFSVSIDYWSTLIKHTQAVNVARFNSKGDMLATGSDDGKVFVWKLAPPDAPAEFGAEVDEDAKEKWHVVGVVRDSSKEVIDLAWSPQDDYIVVGTQGNHAVIYKLTTNETGRISGEAVAQTDERDHTHFVQGVAWDPLNCYIATQSVDKSVNIYRWHQATSKLELVKKHTHVDGKLAYFSEDLNSFFRRLCWTPDGAYLITAAGKTSDDDNLPCVYVFARNHWDSPVWELRGLNKPVVAVSVSPVKYRAGKDRVSTLNYYYLVAVATQDSVAVYSTETWQPLALASNLHYCSICDVSWDASGERIMASSADGFCSTVVVPVPGERI